jgi:hypothetical protein
MSKNKSNNVVTISYGIDIDGFIDATIDWIWHMNFILLIILTLYVLEIILDN